MAEFLTTPVAQAVLWTATLAFLAAFGYYLMRRFRDGADDNREGTHELLTNFREMHHGGELSDAEFRTIKSVLGAKLQQELNDHDNAG